MRDQKQEPGMKQMVDQERVVRSGLKEDLEAGVWEDQEELKEVLVDEKLQEGQVDQEGWEQQEQQSVQHWKRFHQLASRRTFPLDPHPVHQMPSSGESLRREDSFVACEHTFPSRGAETRELRERVDQG
jgi:hypothetical protein